MRCPPIGSIQSARKGEVAGIGRIGTSCGSRAIWFDLILMNTDCFSDFFLIIQVTLLVK